MVINKFMMIGDYAEVDSYVEPQKKHLNDLVVKSLESATNSISNRVLANRQENTRIGIITHQFIAYDVFLSNRSNASQNVNLVERADEIFKNWMDENSKSHPSWQFPDTGFKLNLDQKGAEYVFIKKPLKGASLSDVFNVLLEIFDFKGESKSSSLLCPKDRQDIIEDIEECRLFRKQKRLLNDPKMITYVDKAKSELQQAGKSYTQQDLYEKTIHFAASDLIQGKNVDALKIIPDIVMAAVKLDGNALKYASAEIKKNRDIVMAAVQQNWGALKYASAKLKNDREIVTAAVQQNGNALMYASAELRDNRDIVMAAVKRNAMALLYASDKLKKDKGIVMAAVQQNWRALKYASAELKNDREVLLIVVSKNKLSLDLIHPELRSKIDQKMGFCSSFKNKYALFVGSLPFKINWELSCGIKF